MSDDQGGCRWEGQGDESNNYWTVNGDRNGLLNLSGEKCSVLVIMISPFLLSIYWMCSRKFWDEIGNCWKILSLFLF